MRIAELRKAGYISRTEVRSNIDLITDVRLSDECFECRSEYQIEHNQCTGVCDYCYKCMAKVEKDFFLE